MSVSTPEGYAYYSLYPETYLEAAKRCVDQLPPARAFCIGIRSIGTNLSAVAAATLEQRSVTVQSFTVRPKGHPFDRQLRLPTELAEQWRARGDAHFLIVDEGPGLGGSSFCSVVRALMDLGLAENRLVFFPSRQTRYGQTKLSRAKALAAAGFAPRALGLTYGFLKSEFARGPP